MKAIKQYEYEGKGIVFTEDGWINATQTAAELGKERLDNFLASREYTEYAGIVAESNSLKISDLKTTKRGRYNSGTYLHRCELITKTRLLHSDPFPARARNGCELITKTRLLHLRRWQ